MGFLNKTPIFVCSGKLPFFREWLCLLLVTVFIGQLRAGDTMSVFNHLEYNDSKLFHKEYLDSVIAKNGTFTLPQINELKFILTQPNPDSDIFYIYKLHGFDQSWDTTNVSVIRYTNLPGGPYRLEIMACKNDQVIATYELPITVFNAIRKQWWFGPLLTLCILLIPFIIFYFFNLDRSRRSLRLETVRNQIASDLHDDIGANLSAIKNFTEIIGKKTPKDNTATTLIEKTKSYLDLTITGLQDTVWAINPNNDSVELLIEKMQDFAVLMLSAKDIDLEIKNGYDKKYPAILDMDQRHNLLLMFKEVINNIVKHSGAKNVAVHIGNNRESLQLSIKDNGKGFDAAKSFDGNGLRNFKSRSRQNFIETAITSEVGEGTKVHITAYSL